MATAVAVAKLRLQAALTRPSPLAYFARFLHAKNTIFQPFQLTSACGATHKTEKLADSRHCGALTDAFCWWRLCGVFCHHLLYWASVKELLNSNQSIMRAREKYTKMIN